MSVCVPRPREKNTHTGTGVCMLCGLAHTYRHRRVNGKFAHTYRDRRVYVARPCAHIPAQACRRCTTFAHTYRDRRVYAVRPCAHIPAQACGRCTTLAQTYLDRRVYAARHCAHIPAQACGSRAAWRTRTGTGGKTAPHIPGAVFLIQPCFLYKDFRSIC